MSINVLVADDDKEIREMLVELMEMGGITVRAVNDGLAMVDEADRRAYDVLVFDNHMPGLNGVEAFQRIVSEGGLNARTPGILLTGIPSGGDQSYWAEIGLRAKESGVREVIQKPFNLSYVMNQVREYAQKREEEK